MQRAGILVRLFRKANPNYLELHKRNNSGIHGPDFLFFSFRQIFAAARQEADGDANAVVLKDQREEAGTQKAKQRWHNKAGNVAEVQLGRSSPHQQGAASAVAGGPPGQVPTELYW